MKHYPVPFNDPVRLEAVRAFLGDAIHHDPVFNDLLDIARDAFGTPIALVSLVAQDEQVFVGSVGLDLEATPRSHSLCAHAIMRSEPLIVPDARNDPRFANNPVVCEPPHLRFYVGAPVILASGYRIGTVCAVDFEPHEPPSVDQILLLERLAKLTSTIVDNRIKTAEATEQSKASHTTFLSLISHELRTPLNGIMGLSSLMSAKLTDHWAQDFVTEIRASAEQLTRLIDQILRYTDASTGEILLNEETIPPANILKRVIDLNTVSAQAQGKSLSIKSSLPGAKQADVFADASLTEVVLCSLVSNSIIHGGDNIEIFTEPMADGALGFHVTDNGTGMTDEHIAKALCPFSVAEQTFERTGSGLGLGLPLANKLMEAQGGELVLNTTPGAMRVSAILPPWRSTKDAAAFAARRSPRREREKAQELIG